MTSENLSISRVIETDPESAYRAFTNATELRGWLCNVATVIPRPGGRLYMWWESGFYTSGEFTAAEPGKSVSFTWFGKGDPAQSQVEVTFSRRDEGTLVELIHKGIGDGQEWENSRAEISKGWQKALENLNSVVTTGEDLRFVTRPMLGIILDEFNAEIAKKLGLSSSDGIRIGSTVSGMGAEAAGIQENDVLTSMGGMPTIDFESLNQALNIRKAGDTVEVVFYRDGKQDSLQMTLSGRYKIYMGAGLMYWDALQLHSKSPFFNAGHNFSCPYSAKNSSLSSLMRSTPMLHCSRSIGRGSSPLPP